METEAQKTEGVEQQPKGFVEKAHLNRALRMLPNKIEEAIEEKRKKSLTPIKEAVKQCFETHPSLLELTTKEIKGILSSLGIEAGTAIINSVRVSFKTPTEMPSGTPTE